MSRIRKSTIWIITSERISVISVPLEMLSEDENLIFKTMWKFHYINIIICVQFVVKTTTTTGVLL